MVQGGELTAPLRGTQPKRKLGNINAFVVNIHPKNVFLKYMVAYILKNDTCAK